MAIRVVLISRIFWTPIGLTNDRILRKTKSSLNENPLFCINFLSIIKSGHPEPIILKIMT